MTRLVIVSNRVALPDEHGSLSPGGMAIALNAALKRQGGLWMGWSGKVKVEKNQVSLATQEANGITYALADLSQKDLDEYYYGFANRLRKTPRRMASSVMSPKKRSTWFSQEAEVGVEVEALLPGLRPPDAMRFCSRRGT
ncbi:MAG: hypothetical protein EOR72_31830 [Mesorhizobium sp.]|uniref:hypothetical protein n=1 Tax=Mesorhizobium sp. TaxID=1871066 RepID=UPI000FE717B2|nr:hypothetical protein [Mesorhizobium sp.]RWM06294.1 MAG: hypothetical protein EOR72_31830 [Mesorhizobium sp.]